MRQIWFKADEFRTKLSVIKRRTPLSGAAWYPYDSLASMEMLDPMLGGDPEELRKIIGAEPALDLGCGDGDVAFFLESQGANAHAFDHAATNFNCMAGVQAMKRALGSSVEIHAADLDRPIALPAPQYGLALLMGILYHLKNPYMILETLARKARYCFLSTRIAALTPDRKTNIGPIPVAYLLDEGEANQDDTNYWIFSEAGLRRILKRSGWTVLDFHATGNARSSDPVSTGGDARAYCLLESRMAQPSRDVRLLSGWHHLEFATWRWTERRFSIAIEMVSSGARMLRFRLHLPPPVFAERTSVTLSAAMNGTPLTPQTYVTPGDHEYVRPVTVDAGVVQVDFELDSAIAPSLTDSRELGLQVDFATASPVVLDYPNPAIEHSR